MDSEVEILRQENINLKCEIDARNQTIESLQENLDDRDIEMNILKTALGNIEYEVKNAFKRLENVHVP